MLDVLSVNLVLSVVDLSNDKVRDVGYMLSKLLPGWEGLKAVRINRVVEHNEDILGGVLDNLVPSLANYFFHRRVDISLRNRGALVIGSQLVSKEVFSELNDLVLGCLSSWDCHSILSCSKFSRRHDHYDGELRFFNSREFLQVGLDTLFLSARSNEVDLTFQGISSFSEGSVVACTSSFIGDVVDSRLLLAKDSLYVVVNKLKEVRDGVLVHPFNKGAFILVAFTSPFNRRLVEVSV